MKKLLFIAAATVGMSSLVQATTINATSLVGTSSLNGNNAYLWGAAISVPVGQTVQSAEIDFTLVTLNIANSTGTGYLYTDLLNSKSQGVSAQVDNDAAGDYWGTLFKGANITSIGVEFFKKVGTTLTWSYVLDSSELTALNTYLSNNKGILDIGIDPDCNYTVGGLSLTYSFTPTTPHTAPDVAATAFLLILGLAAVEVFRRQLVFAKIKG